MKTLRLHPRGERRPREVRLPRSPGDSPDLRSASTAFSRRATVRSCSTRRQLSPSRATSSRRLVALVTVGPRPGHDSRDEQDGHEGRASHPPRAEDPPHQPQPEDARDEEPERGDDVQPEHLRPGVAKTPIRLDPISPAATTNAMISRLIATSSLLHELVQPLVDEADLDLTVSHLLEHVVHLVRVLGEDRRELRAIRGGRG